MMPAAFAPWGQGDPRWSQQEIVPGDPTSRLARIGCAVAAVLNAAEWLGTSRHLDPGALTTLARERNGFVGPSRAPDRKTLTVWPVVCGLVGLHAHVGARWLRNTPDVSALRKGIADCLQREEACILHVDRDEEGKHFAGDHYVTGLRLTGMGLEVADSAGAGKIRYLDPMTLTGPSPWGRLRPYRVRGLLPVGRAVQ